jgi:hypothetical protein
MHQQDAYRMIQRRAEAAGIETKIGNHTFRATGITAYLKNSGKLEVAHSHDCRRSAGRVRAFGPCSAPKRFQFGLHFGLSMGSARCAITPPPAATTSEVISIR